MKKIIGGRGTGKSTELIRRSADTGNYIVVPSKRRANHLFKQACLTTLQLFFKYTTFLENCLFIYSLCIFFSQILPEIYVFCIYKLYFSTTSFTA